MDRSRWCATPRMSRSVVRSAGCCSRLSCPRRTALSPTGISSAPCRAMAVGTKSIGANTCIGCGCIFSVFGGCWASPTASPWRGTPAGTFSRSGRTSSTNWFFSDWLSRPGGCGIPRTWRALPTGWTRHWRSGAGNHWQILRGVPLSSVMRPGWASCDCMRKKKGPPHIWRPVGTGRLYRYCAGCSSRTRPTNAFSLICRWPFTATVAGRMPPPSAWMRCADPVIVESNPPRCGKGNGRSSRTSRPFVGPRRLNRFGWEPCRAIPCRPSFPRARGTSPVGRRRLPISSPCSKRRTPVRA